MHLEKLVGDIKAQEKESTGSSEVSSTSETKTSRVGGFVDLRLLCHFEQFLLVLAVTGIKTIFQGLIAMSLSSLIR